MIFDRKKERKKEKLIRKPEPLFAYIENVELWDRNPVSIGNLTQICRTIWS